MSRVEEAQKFIREVRDEAEKVVWPDHKETTQSTLLVLVMVVLVALFLWLVDSGLGWLVQKVI